MSLFSTSTGATVTRQAVRQNNQTPVTPTAVRPSSSSGGSSGSGGGSSSGGVTQTPPPSGGNQQLESDPTALVRELRASFPWIDQIGLDIKFFQEMAATVVSADELVIKLRETPQFKQRFPGLYRSDGTIRMTEGQYLQQEAGYRQLLRQYGYPEDQYKTPASLVGFFENEIDPNELQERLDVYQQVKDGSQELKDAMYVYAGMDVTDDDLFEAIVDPAAGQQLADKYNAQVAAQQFDYAGFITRATQAGLSRVASELTKMQKTGAVTGAVVQRVLSVDPNFARQIMDVLYTGGQSVNEATPLSLQELLATFEEAALGAAATEVGLELPTLERIQELRAAGVQRTQAQQAYREFARNENLYGAAVQRARGSEFGQQDFEAAVFLGDAAATTDLAQGLAYEAAAGRSQGSFQFDQDRTGRIFQRGLRAV